MPRQIFNWTFSDVVRLLKDNHFSLNHVEGSHYFYVGNYNKKFRQVCVPFHGVKALDPKTMKGIINQSGIPKEKWFNAG
ncbi:MAG: type II toxin-antitoxin system HicA family toxin [bacterium]|nr:type II toxin-antitoxin system HicA family toxin [bacterium]